MDLALEPEMYSPIVNGEMQYADQVPKFPPAGLRCPCSARNVIYKSRQSFVGHIKTKGHGAWLDTMNSNRANHYVECENLKALVSDQRKIITEMSIKNAQLEKSLLDANHTIDYLSKRQTTLSSKKFD